MKQQNWTFVAQYLAQAIAQANAENEPLDKLYLFVDPETGDSEITNTDEFSTCPLYIGPVSLFDEKGLLTIDDAKSNYVLDLFIEIIEDAIEEEEEEENDEEEEN